MYSMPVALASMQAEFGVDARRRLAALHAHHDRLRPRRHPDGTACRPLRRHRPRPDRRASPRRRLHRRRHAPNLLQFALAHGLLIGLLGCSATFAPLVADTSLWFNRRRGIAVAICASGNYLAGAVWPPVLQHFFEAVGWRATYIGVGIFCLAAMLPLALALRRRPPHSCRFTRASCRTKTCTRGRSACRRTRSWRCSCSPASPAAWRWRCRRSTSSPTAATSGTARRAARRCSRSCSASASSAGSPPAGSATASADCARSSLGSVLQGIALVLFLPFDGLVSLYVVSALFGLFQGGIVPSYAIIVREYFPPREAGAARRHRASWRRSSAWPSAAGCRARSST